MSLATQTQSGEAILTAPASGRAEFCPPRALCGELEVFEPGETVATVGGGTIDAPDRGFVLRTLVADGELVTEGTPVVSYRIA